MKNRDAGNQPAIQEIANVLAAAYLRLRFPAPPQFPVDCPDTKSDSSCVG